MTKPHLIIPAAGVGSRMQADRPKQYLSLAGKTVIEHTLSRLVETDLFDQIIVVLSSEDPFWASLPISKDSRIQIVEGGAERCDSVLNGLSYLNQSAQSNDIVLVHDCARPCVSIKDIRTLLNQDLSSGGLLAIRAKDTLKQSKTGSHYVESTLDRSAVWQAYTPQAAPVSLLFSALTEALNKGIQITDEASALEAKGLKPLLVESSDLNLKITRPDDLILAEAILNSGVV